MLEKLKEKLRPWGEAMAGLDDPQGEYLAYLENRIVRVEKEVEELRQLLKTKPLEEQNSSH